MNLKFKSVFSIFIAIMIVFLLNSIAYAEDTNGVSSYTPIRGKVLKVIKEYDEIQGQGKESEKLKVQNLQIEILEGKYRGKKVSIDNHISTSKQNGTCYANNDEVLLIVEPGEKGEISSVSIYQFARDKYLKYFLISFCIIMVLIGRWKGIKSLLTLGITVFFIVNVFLKYILKGYNPFMISIFVCICITTVTFVIVSGINRKTISVILGTTGGVMIAELIAVFVGNLCKINAISSEEAQVLLYSNLNNPLNFKNIFFATVLIGALGAVMDVSMSISSSMSEIREANGNISTAKLMKSGMNIGRDIMGTMSNTLVLAYASGATFLILSCMANGVTLLDMINQDMITCEIIKTLSGSIGLIFTIPFTVIISGILDR
ncbi:YibE/F family protein [Clostridium botulinum]|uniref:YibE/F family protein n=1 Tax=Clostridium botulinum TaxID=1491 RepID=UPI0005849160|nr:YibE/F family protein [Clostridium botulinum]AJE12813.1 yibE/F-like family protein [Clostridium botulinum CDC_1436]